MGGTFSKASNINRLEKSSKRNNGRMSLFEKALEEHNQIQKTSLSSNRVKSASSNFIAGV
jgi:hypothetical protein